jgi:hypothetical protein
VYNDVGVAIACLRREGFTGRIAVVDLDYHQPDGTIRGFLNDPDVLVYSIHGSEWTSEKGATTANHLLPPGATDESYLRHLRTTLPEALRAHGARLVFYVAGTDVLRGDRFGNFSLTPDGALARDRTVVETARASGAGLIATLGGGYSRLAWQCSADFASWLLTDEARPAARWEAELRDHYDRIAEAIDPTLLQTRRSNDSASAAGWSEEDIREDLKLGASPERILGFYSEQGIEFALERYGILQKIRGHGHRQLSVQADASDPERQIIRVSSEAGLLVELVLKRAGLEAPTEIAGAPDLKFLAVEWLLLQDPKARFAPDKPPLPGQKFPGLGVAEEIQELLVQACKRLELDGLLSHPAHFHNASVPLRHFHFLDPEAEGRFLAIRHVLSRYPLTDASRLLDDGALALGNHTPVSWRSSEYVLPVSARLRGYFESPNYSARCLEESRRLLQAGLHVEARPGSPSPIP